MSAEPRAGRSFRRWTALLLIAGAAVGLASLMDGARPAGPRPVQAAELLRPAAEAPCDRWTLLAGSGQARGASVSLFTNGLAVLRACDASPRELRLRGTVAAGAGAFAVMVDDAGVAYAGPLAGEARVEVRGDLRLYFTNDLATADQDRNLHAAFD